MRYVFYPLLMGALGWWAAFFIMPLAVQWEFPLATVDRIPVFGFCLGIGLGIAMGYRENVRDSVWFVFASIAFGGFAWLVIVMAAGFVLTIALDGDAFDNAMEIVNTVAVWVAWGLAAALIGVGAYAFLYDKAGALRERFLTKRRKAP